MSSTSKLLMTFVLILSVVFWGTPNTTQAAPSAQALVKNKVWAIQLLWDDNGKPWSKETFASLKQQGINRVEINLAWNEIEPSRNTFSFAKLDADLRNAAAIGLNVVPIFWQSVWGGNPASWINSFDVTSTGAKAQIPAWWNSEAKQDYFNYVTTTIRHIGHQAGFGGAFLDYGWLDAMWGPTSSGITGYAQDDIAKFHEWLPLQYRSIDSFNTQYGTTYTDWSEVPAAKPGDKLFPVYQTFRAWSVKEIYDELTAKVREETSAPLFYYWGGDLANAVQYTNLPDLFFQLAHKYHATVVLDDANSTGLALLFGSLARAYDVSLLQEWTPLSGTNVLNAEAAQWLVHTGLAEPRNDGQDFFAYQGGEKYDVGFPRYVSWIHAYSQVEGSYPEQPVAVYVRFAPALQGDAQTMLGLNNAIRSAWLSTHVAFTVVTDREVADHVVNLSRFRAVLPLDGTDKAINQYAALGGHVLSSPDQLTNAAPAYMSVTPSSASSLVEAIPTVDATHKRAWIAIAETSPVWNFNGGVQFRYDALGLPQGTYHLIDATTGQTIPAVISPTQIGVPLQLSSGALDLWELVPGPEPTGTPQVTYPTSSTLPGTVTAVAGQQPDNLTFLGVGATGIGSDGNLSLINQGGTPAIATWTISQSGVPGAYAYLQINPGTRVYTAQTVTFSVTYWASPGQGFSVQYDGAKSPYESSSSVTSPGTNQWETATVTVTDADFSESQNGGADFRLAVKDPSQPLVIRQVSVSVQ